MPTELREALTAAQASALVPKVISPALLELVRRYSPLVRAVPTEPWHTTTYFFNSRSVLPSGGFVTDGGAKAVSNSTYIQSSFPVKLLQTVGSVTGYAQAVTAMQVGNLQQKEIDGARQGLIWDIENAMLWGNAGATASGVAPQFDGLDTLVSTWSGSTQNAIDVNGALALRTLDQLIDLVEENAAQPLMSDWMFVCAPDVESKVAQLLTNQQRFMTVDVAPGLNVSSYRNLPIIKSSFLAARSVTMGTITPTASGAGTLPVGTYKYQVSAVIGRYGETVASAEVSQAVSGSNLAVLTFSTPTGPDGNGPVAYKVYRTLVGGATGTETLIGIVDAFDTTGAAVTVIQDSGTNLLTNSLANTGPATYQGASAAFPLAATQENIYLIPRNPDFLVRPYVRDLTLIPLSPTVTAPDQDPFAIVSDTTLAVRGPKYMARAGRVTVAI